MKSNAIMTRKMGEFDVLQRTSDGMFNATELLRQWNGVVGNKRRDMDNFWKQTGLLELMKEIAENELGILSIDYKYLKSKLSHTSRGRINGSTFMHPFLFLFFCSYIDDNLFKLANEFIYKNDYIFLNKLNKKIKYRNRKEVILLNQLKSSFDSFESSTFDIETHIQYPFIDNKYKVDMLIIQKLKFNDEFKNRYTIIEYDEKHHEKKIEDDENRINNIVIYLKKNKHKLDIKSIELIRIKEGQEGLAFLYIIPYITGLGNTEDKLIDCFSYNYYAI